MTILLKKMVSNAWRQLDLLRGVEVATEDTVAVAEETISLDLLCLNHRIGSNNNGVDILINLLHHLTDTVVGLDHQ